MTSVRRRAVLVLAATLSAGLVVCGVFLILDTLLDRTTVTTRTVPGPVKTLDLFVATGDVRLTGHDGNDVVVTRRVTRGVLEPADVIGRREGDVVGIVSACQPRIRRCRVVYDITVPRDASITGFVGDGTVTVSGVGGRVQVSTPRGSVVSRRGT
ncbi:hypothetical protein [Microbispora sp. KK1-11]|uniref:hypothetical protein n=1 Tax=Microbispora sp. KK1-11 TaxID=2053005 RepID=UPI0011596252|nr:hypothetical protein [Microbispora sp. KK1-11]TQS28841.1 hypothetical protein FLW16_13785 [Microbispora sp. KK1-11]